MSGEATITIGTNWDGQYPAPEGMVVPPRVVEAVGVALMHANEQEDPGIREGLMAAMTQAVRDAQAQGVTDPDVIRERILIARDYAILSIRGKNTGLDIMARAIEQAQASGVNDPEEIAARVLRALQMSQAALEAAAAPQ